MTEDQEKKYLTPYVSGTVDLGKNIGEVGRFIAKTLKLPASVQNIFRNFSTAEFIEEKLGPAFSLNADQKTEITRILRNILLADLFWGEFAKTVSDRLQVDTNTANQIVKIITEQLLTPALDDIKTMQKNKFGDRIAQAKENQTQPPPAPPVPPRRPAGFIRPGETVQQGNVVDLRNTDN